MWERDSRWVVLERIQVIQCDQMQDDGRNCGVITLKVAMYACTVKNKT